MTHEVAITGVGFVTSIGHCRADVATSLRELRHGFAPWHPLGGGIHPVTVAGVLRGFDVSAPDPGARSWPAERALCPEAARAMPPQGIYALCALREALEDAHLTREDLGDGSTGLYCASAGSAMLLHHHLGKLDTTQYRRGHPLCVVNSISGTLNFHLASLLGIRGAGCGFVSACASSSHALGFAFDEIALGRQQRMIVVGAEELTIESFLPFHTMAALSTNPDPDSASRPFDLQRDGFVGTGGCVAMILESAERARARGVRAQAHMRGWGQASDGHHAAQPHPDGAGLRDAMRLALSSSRVAPRDIGYVNAHATSTIAGDRAEARALHEVFTRSGATPPMSSTKALTGHGLSLAGVMEAAFCVLALDAGFTPGQAHLHQPDPEAQDLNLPRTSQSTNPSLALNNSSGFGGANVCHVFSTAR
jgi:3-oxoacyl-(acyl-carrier-protein) synthase